jgi:hypothetical protein
MQRLPLEIQTLYAELLERLAAREALRAIGQVPGSFVTKRIKGQEYAYFQYLEPGGTKRQVYLGRRDDTLDAVAAKHADQRAEGLADEESIQRLATLLRAGGALTTDTPSARVLRALSDAAVFRLGGVLVGTHAFTVLGNVLGVRWSGAALRTQDVDMAAARHMDVAVPSLSADVPDILAGLEMGFLPVPGLDPASPSTSFKVRGQGLRIDLLTPAQRSGGRPVLIPRLAAAAQPLKYLDYLLEDPVRAAVIDGGGTSVNVPGPARFALHKLIVANERPVVFHAKADKDLAQAAQVLAFLTDERPGDVRLAWEAAAGRGSGWAKRLRSGLGSLDARDPETTRRVRALVRE